MTLSQVILRGLIASRDEPRKGTSNDGVTLVSFSGPQPQDLENREVVAAVELKTFVSQASTIAATRRLESLHRTNGPSAFVMCQFGSDVFKLLVETVDKRVQTIHHPAVDGLCHTLFVAATTQTILYAALIEFGDDMISAYKAAIAHGLATVSLESISRIPAADLGYAVDQHTVSCWRRLSRAIKDENERRRRADEPALPPAHAILPSAVSIWNNVKGGQDVVSRILKNVKVDFRSLTPRTFIWFRFVLLSLLNAHLINRLLNVSASVLYRFSSTPVLTLT